MFPFFLGAMGASADARRVDALGAYAAKVGMLARAIVAFSERHPALAFEAGIEPIALEMKVAMGYGSSEAAGAGISMGRLPATPSFASLSRAADLEREAHRRLSEYERAALAAESPGLGAALERALSVASSIVMIGMAIA